MTLLISRKKEMLVKKVTTYILCFFRDESERLHSLRVKIQAGYPIEEPIVEADLPVDIDITWNTVSLRESVSDLDDVD